MMTKKLDIVFKGISWNDYLYWQKQDKKTLKRINKLINSTIRQPFDGLGDPEKLKGQLSGYWSRRINQSDRMVYAVYDDRIEIIQLRFHYSK
ncbi:Txe/YoeB family addiction module toxin [Lactobacillus crispatus]|uniref:Txe/YoeB family addiction module toxin n=1 Tax=Lactobacillus crispatus TaxID=47770 RepID=UPI003A4C7D48